MENKIQTLKPILAERQLQVIAKRLKNQHLTQVESNYLNKAIRPKLKAAQIATDIALLNLLEYKRKKYEKDDKVLKDKILTSVKDIAYNIKSIILYGSYIQNNKSDYRDIDIMIVVKRKFWKNQFEKGKIGEKIRNNLGIPSDILLISQKSLNNLYPYDPFLQTALENHKVIYGKIKINRKRKISHLYLYKKLLDEADTAIEMANIIESKYIYNGIRSCISIDLFLNGQVSLKLINEIINNKLGDNIIKKLKNNTATKTEKRIAVDYLKNLYKNLEKQLR